MRIKSILFPTKTADVVLSLKELDFLFAHGFKDDKRGTIDKYGILQHIGDTK